RCFLEHGPHASCERIAEDLGVSSAALFKRFGTKENLQRVALTPVPPPWLEDLAAGPLPDLPLRGQLLDLGGRFLFFFREMLPCVFALRAAGSVPDFAAL